MNGPEQQTHFRSVWRRFRQNKPAYLACWVLGLMALMALLAPVLANQKPLYARYMGHSMFPAFQPNKTYIIKTDTGELELPAGITPWKQMNFEKAIWAPVAYAPGQSDYANAQFKSPSEPQFIKQSDGTLSELPTRFRHFLGTNKTGADVAAGLIHGARISLSTALVSMAIAALLGITLGSLAGYFGNRRLRWLPGKVLGFVTGCFLAWFYALYNRRFVWADALADGQGAFALTLLLSVAIGLVVVVCCTWAGSRLGNLLPLKNTIALPVDHLISRTIEVVQSLPVFLLVITLAAIAKPSLWNVMVLIALTSWTGIARLTRAEILKVKEAEYITAATAIGIQHFRILYKHILPNSLAPAMVSVAFGMASAILIESSLSFLGVGVPPGTVTWGSLVNEGRQQYSAWWLVVFPGLFIFITVTALNLVGDALRDALDPQ